MTGAGRMSAVCMLCPSHFELVSGLSARMACAEPGGAFFLMGEGEDLGDTGVGGEEVAEEFGAVAFAAAVKEDDVAREAVGAEGGLGAIED